MTFSVVAMKQVAESNDYSRIDNANNVHFVSSDNYSNDNIHVRADIDEKGSI
jgi:hypothetical protein